MELKDFIETALTQLIEGVNSASKFAKSNGAEINPASLKGELNGGYNANRKVADIKFDIAIAVSEGTGTKAGISVLGGAINLGAGGESKAENSVVSRIQFTVPIALPKQEE